MSDAGKGPEWRKGTDFKKYREAPYWEKEHQKVLDLGQFDDEALLLEGCDEAITMVTMEGAPVYSYEALIKVFQGQGMTEEDAIEWIDYNVLGLAGNGDFHVGREVLWTST